MPAALGSAGRLAEPPVVLAPVLADAVSLELEETLLALAVVAPVEPPAPLVVVPPVLPLVAVEGPVAPVVVAGAGSSLQPKQRVKTNEPARGRS